MRPGRFVIAAVVTLCCSVLTPPLRAEAGDMRFQFGVVYSMPTDNLSQTGETFEAQSAFGFQASFEYLFNSWIGLEPQIAMISHEVDLVEGALPSFQLGEVDLFALNARLNFHLLGDSKVDRYAGAIVGYAFWGDLESGPFDTAFPTDDDFTYGVSLGVDVPLGDGSWAFSGVLAYQIMDLTLKGDALFPELGIDPVQLQVGAAYRF